MDWPHLAWRFRLFLFRHCHIIFEYLEPDTGYCFNGANDLDTTQLHRYHTSTLQYIISPFFNWTNRLRLKANMGASQKGSSWITMQVGSRPTVQSTSIIVIPSIEYY